MATEVLPSTRPQRHSVRIASLVVLAALLGGGMVVYRRNHAPDATSAVTPTVSHAESTPATSSALPVRVETASLGALSAPIRVTGTLKTDETITLSTRATGMVKKVFAKEGDRVQRGQLLVLLDDADIRAQRDRDLAALHAAESRLAQAVTSKGIKNSAAASEYRRSQEALAVARTRLDQAKSLAGIAGTEADTRVASAKSNLQAANERLKQLREGSRKQEKAAAEAAVARAEVQVKRMKSALTRRQRLLQDGAIAQETVDNAQRDYEAALTDLESSKQQLSLVQEGPRTEEIRVAEEAVQQADAALRDAEANRARRQISNQDVDTAQNQVQQAEATLEQAKAGLAQTQWNQDEIRAARAAVNQAHADLRYRNEILQETKIYSPVAGLVTQRKAHDGEAVVQMRNELMTIVSLDTLYLEATAPESSFPYLQPGLPAEIRLDAMPGKTYTGTIREIIPVAEANNRSIRLRISLPKTSELGSVVGGFARAEIRGKTRTAAISVPRSAIVSDEGDLGVFLYQDGHARRRKVQIDPASDSGGRVAVLQGLQPGDRVITSGAAGLTDGAVVAIKS